MTPDATCRACGWVGPRGDTAPFDRCPHCKQDTVRDDVVYNAPPTDPDLFAGKEAS